MSAYATENDISMVSLNIDCPRNAINQRFLQPLTHGWTFLNHIVLHSFNCAKTDTTAFLKFGRLAMGALNSPTSYYSVLLLLQLIWISVQISMQIHLRCSEP